MVNLFVPMGGFACLTESGVCFRYVAKKTLEFFLKTLNFNKKLQGLFVKHFSVFCRIFSELS